MKVSEYFDDMGRREAMGKVARNALKGYTFQHYIFTLFLAKMDSDRAIKKIESEAITDGNFDDLYIEANECVWQ